MSQTIRNGQSIRVNIQTGEKLSAVAVTGSYSITVLAGTGTGTSLATSATGGTYGPYAYPLVVQIVSSAESEIDYDAGVTTSIESDTVALLKTDPLTGKAAAILDADGVEYSLCKTFASGIQFVMPSSGNISNTAGAIAVTTGFDYVLGPSYAYFPVGALFAASPAGWYYTNWTSATIGVVYANTYFNGTPVIPATPTPLVTVAGSYTQATGVDVMGPTTVIPADFLGVNGFIEWNRVVNNNNSAGAKIYNTYLGATTFQGLSQTTNPREAGQGTIKNRGRKTAQVAANAAHGDNNNASSIVKLSIDTEQSQLFGMSIQLAVATDYAMIESFFVRANRVL